MRVTRNTYQRELVKQSIATLANHPSADEIYEYISIRNSHVSKGTVYRNLTILSELGEILRIEIANGPDRYDHVSKEHYHLKCSVCGKVKDSTFAYQPVPQELIDTSETRDGFKIHGYSVLFIGKCADCITRESMYSLNFD